MMTLMLLLLLVGNGYSEFMWPVSVSRNLLRAEAIVEEDETCPIPEGLEYIETEFRHGGIKRWYKFVTSVESHSSAKQVCQNAGGHLITFRNQVEYDWMIQIAETWNQDYGIWVDLETKVYGSLNQQDTFQWEDGSAFTGGKYITAGLDADNSEETPCLYYDKTTGSITDHEGGCEGSLKAVCQYDCPNDSGTFSPKVIDARHFFQNEWESQLDKIFIDGCESHRVWDKYIGPNKAVDDNAYFVVDLGAKVTLMGVKLRNLQNANFHDRTTENFSIYLSDLSDVFDNIIVHDTLTDARNVACEDIPLESFYFSEIQGRYVKFEINSYKGQGGGLKYIEFVAKDFDVCSNYRMDFQVLEEVSYEESGDIIYPAQNILLRQPACDAYNTDPSLFDTTAGLWKSKPISEEESPYFIIDTHCYFSATRLHIRNGVNLSSKDCGVRAFQLLASLDMNNWVAVVSGFLGDLREKPCTEQENSIYPFQPTDARYFKFQVLSTISGLNFACLQYFDVD